jgi:hypothetical protein
VDRLPIYMGDVPEYVVRGNLMHIIWRDLELVLPVAVMLAGMANAQEALARWQLEALEDKIVELRPRH